MCRLCQPINNHPNRIIPTRRPWEISNEIHSDTLPFPNRNLWLMQKPRWLLMLNLDFRISQTLTHILFHSPLHTRPPVKILQIFIHFIRTRMHRIIRPMSLVRNQLSKRNRNLNTTKKIQNSIIHRLKLSS